MRKTLGKLNKGFTLLEILVSVAVIGILISVSSAIFINTIRSANKANATVEARENGANVLELFAKDVRSSADASPNGTSTSVLLNNSSGAITWNCDNTEGVITRQVGSAGSILPVTNKDPQNGVSIKDCSFETTSANGVYLVKILFTITQPSGVSGDFSVNLPYSESYATRIF